MNKLACILSAAALMTVAAAAQRPATDIQIVKAPDQRPNEPEWVRKRLPDLFSSGVRARMIAMPSFSPDYGVAIAQNKSGYRLSYRATRANFPGDWFWLPVPEDRCDAEIDPALARRVIAVWRHMIHDVFPHEPERMGLDGALYDFTLAENGTTALAETWSPGENTAPAQFVEIGDDLAAYCTSARYWFLAPVTWYNGTVIEEKLAKLESVKPGK